MTSSSTKTNAVVLALADPSKLVNARIFFYHPTRAWELVTVLSTRLHDPRQNNGPAATVKDSRGDRLEISLKPDNIYIPTPGMEDRCPDNLLTLSELHLSVLLNSLRMRFMKDLIYTYLGELVVAVNPFKYTIPWYQPHMIQKYIQHRQTGTLPDELHPHTWSVAHRSYVEMHRSGRNQSIIISGESGAGKTESCKIMLNYLCTISATNCGAEDSAAKERAVAISEKVQQASPILEAFGNAKTIRNDNSSRFGKFMEVQFNEAGVLCGMRTTPYLLEKSRVVTSGNEERVYHCFYQLVAGASESLKQELRLGKGGPREFRLLMEGNAPMIRGVDDAVDFKRVEEAMTIIGFSADDKSFVWRTVAAILHLTNVTFDENKRESRATLSGVSEINCIFVANDLLKIEDASSFVKCLTTHTTMVRNEVLSKHLSKQKAEDQRDSLCKHLYQKLFFWIIAKINDATAANYSVDPPRTWIGLLDIFGFEDFNGNNSFEQLCINLANETLQRHYTRYIFMKDIQEVKDENIEAESVNYRDNQPCLELLQGKTDSVISMLNDASTLDFERSSTDPNVTFLHKLTMHYKPDFNSAGNKGTKSVLERHPDEMTTPADFFHRGRLDNDTFTIRHYAGDVKYKVANFVEKNIDTLKEFVFEVLCRSTDERLLAVMNTSDDFSGDPSASSPSFDNVRPSNNSMAGGGGVPPMSPTSPRRGQRKTVGSQFRTSLAGLMQLIESTQPNWVRCIRPHPRKQPNMFDGKSVLEQLVATGVLETIEQRQRNFPFRIPFDDFMSRFAVVAFQTLRRMGARLTKQDKCRTILSAAGCDDSDFGVGNTKVFLKAPSQIKLETTRNMKMDKLVLTIGHFLRQQDSRQVVQFFRLRKAAIQCQRARRLTVKLQRCCREYYRELWQRIDKKHSEQRRDVDHLEHKERSRFLQSEASERHDLKRQFSHGLAPLVAQVLRNIQMVESRLRLGVEEEENRVFGDFFAMLKDSETAAHQGTRARVAKEREIAIAQQRQLMDTYLRHREQIVDYQRQKRVELYQLITPEIDAMKNKAKKIAQMQKKRHVLLQTLHAERDKELLRLEENAQRQRQSEADLWVEHCGTEGTKGDILHFSGMGVRATSAVKQLDTFYKLGTPTKIVSDTSSSSRVKSYSDYSRMWQEQYDQETDRGVRNPVESVASPILSPVQRAAAVFEQRQQQQKLQREHATASSSAQHNPHHHHSSSSPATPSSHHTPTTPTATTSGAARSHYVDPLLQPQPYRRTLQDEFMMEEDYLQSTPVTPPTTTRCTWKLNHSDHEQHVQSTHQRHVPTSPIPSAYTHSVQRSGVHSSPLSPPSPGLSVRPQRNWEASSATTSALGKASGGHPTPRQHPASFASGGTPTHFPTQQRHQHTTSDGANVGYFAGSL